jgi:hypothetical protein
MYGPHTWLRVDVGLNDFFGDENYMFDSEYDGHAGGHVVADERVRVGTLYRENQFETLQHGLVCGTDERNVAQTNVSLFSTRETRLRNRPSMSCLRLHLSCLSSPTYNDKHLELIRRISEYRAVCQNGQIGDDLHHRQPRACGRDENH